MSKRCNARLTLPITLPQSVASTIFTCSREQDHVDTDQGVAVATPHRETGRVRTTNNKHVRYVIEWQDVEPEVIRG